MPLFLYSLPLEGVQETDDGQCCASCVCLHQRQGMSLNRTKNICDP